MKDQSPARLLHRSRRDPEAFGAFYRSQVHAVLAFVISRLGDVEISWDITAEAFAKAYLKRRSFRGTEDSSAKSWLFSIANREILQYQRRKEIERRGLKKLKVAPEPLTESDLDQTLEKVDSENLEAAVLEEAGKLSDASRRAIQLRVVEERSYSEVARELSTSEESARARVSRALRRLKIGVTRATNRNVS